MEDDLINIVVKSPAPCIGEVVGQLHQHGAWIDDVKDDGDDVFVVHARAPVRAISDLKLWLEKKTDGNGEVFVVK